MGRLLSWEKIFFFIGLAGFLAGSFITWDHWNNSHKNFSPSAIAPKIKNQSFDIISEIPVWEKTSHMLFVSRPLVYDFKNKKIIPLNLSQTDEDNIRYEWKRNNGFSLKNKIAAQDADQDGFSNIEEYHAQTDPRDSSSSPPSVAKLRLKRYEFIPFQFVFQGYTKNSQGGYEYQINVQHEEGNQTLMVELGENLKMKNGMVWKVSDFRPKINIKINPSTGMNQKYDESELDLVIDGLESKKVTLVKGVTQDSRESYVDFVAKIPDEKPILNVCYGSVFTFRGEAYRLVEANDERAIVKKLGSEELISISALEK